MTTAGPVVPAPKLSSLVASEMLRARSRRSLRWLVALALLAVTGVAAIIFGTTGHVTETDLTAAASRYLTEQQQFYQVCMADTSIPEAEKANACWKPTPQDAVDNALWNLPRRPFDASGFAGLIGFAGGVGLLVCAMLAATSGGADWGARTMGLLLSWEPRRGRVFVVRLLVVLGGALVLQTFLMLLAVTLGTIIASAHDLIVSSGVQVNGYSPIIQSEINAHAAKWVPLGALGAAGAYAVAMLTRSTGWAIGTLVGLMAVIESLIQGLWPWGSQWLIQTNSVAWLNGGMQWVVSRTSGSFVGGPSQGEIYISSQRALAVLASLALLACLTSLGVLRARDVE